MCPVGSLSVEWRIVNPELQKEIFKLSKLQRDWLYLLLKEIKNEHDFNASIPEVVDLIMGLIQGSIQQARILDRPELLTQNLKTYLKTLKK